MKPPAFQFYADDFLGGVSDMTQSEVGAYILLLCHQWNKGEIPTEAARASLIAKGRVTPHVLAKFPDGRNPRMELVRKGLDEFRAAQAERGKVGAAKRWHGERHSASNGVAIQTPMANVWPDDGSPSPSPTPINKKKERSAVAAPASDAEWLASLKENPAYDGLNIGIIYGKMQAWCGANKKQPTRRRFINWLNREEKPMPRQVTMAATSKPAEGPPNWRETLALARPGNTYEGAWNTLPPSLQDEIKNYNHP